MGNLIELKAQRLAGEIIEASGGVTQIARDTVRAFKQAACSLEDAAVDIEARGHDFNEEYFPGDAWNMDNPTDEIEFSLLDEARVLRLAGKKVTKELNLNHNHTIYF